MPTHYFISSAIIAALWLLWMGYWAISARATKANAYVQPLRQKLLFRLLLLAAIICMQDIPGLHYRFVPPYLGLEIAGIALCVGGLAFAVWARIHLAGNWSSWVTVKKDHELVTTGPYGIARHPIYTGVITAILGTVVALAPTIGGSLTMLLVTASFLIKLRQEEALHDAAIPRRLSRL